MSRAGQEKVCSTKGWEQRGNNKYYYRKQRDGSTVKSVYVGRGEIAHLVSQIQASSPLLEKLARTIKAPEIVKQEKAEDALEQVANCVRMITQATLLIAGFHTHHRQWRRKRKQKNERDCRQPSEEGCRKDSAGIPQSLMKANKG